MEDPPLEVGTPRKHRTASLSARLLHRWPGRSHQQPRLAYSIMRNDNENSVSWGGLCPLKTPVLESEPPEPGHVTLCGTRGVAAYGTCEDEVTLQGVGGPVSSRTGVLVRRETQREGHVRTRAGLGARRPHAKVTPKTVGGHQKLGDSRRSVGARGRGQTCPRRHRRLPASGLREDKLLLFSATKRAWSFATALRVDFDRFCPKAPQGGCADLHPCSWAGTRPRREPRVLEPSAAARHSPTTLSPSAPLTNPLSHPWCQPRQVRG